MRVDPLYIVFQFDNDLHVFFAYSDLTKKLILITFPSYNLQED
jgi:hypothetical protein